MLLTSGGEVIGVILMFLSLGIALRCTGIKEFGIYGTFLALLNFVVIMADFGLTIFATRYIATSSVTDSAKMMQTLLTACLSASLFVLSILFVARNLLVSFLGIEPFTLFYLPLISVLYTVDLLFLAMLKGLKLFRKVAIRQTINSASFFLSILIVIYWLQMGLSGLLLSTLLASIASCLYGYLTIPLQKGFKLNKTFLRMAYQFSYPLGLNGILDFAFTRGNIVMIAALLNPASVAFYEAARRLPDAMRRIYNGLHAVFFPEISGRWIAGQTKKATELLAKTLRFVSVLTAFGGVIAFIYGKEIVQILFSDKYAASAMAMSLLVIQLNVSLVNNIMGNSLVALGHSEKPLIINIMMVTLTVIGNLLFISMFGFVGAVYSTLIANLSSNLLNSMFLSRLLKLRIGAYVTPTVIMVICCAVFYFANSIGALGGVIPAILFIALTFLLGTVTRHDIGEFLSVLSLIRFGYVTTGKRTQ